MLNYKCRSHDKSSLNLSLRTNRTNFVFQVPGWEQECIQGPTVTSPGQVPLGTRFIRCSCSSAMPTAQPQDPTRSPGKGPPNKGEDAAQRCSDHSKVTSELAVEARPGPAQSSLTLSRGLALSPASPAPTQASTPRLRSGELPRCVQAATRPPAPELAPPPHAAGQDPPSAAAWRDLDHSPLPFSPSQPSFSRLREEPGREGGGELGAAG